MKIEEHVARKQQLANGKVIDIVEQLKITQDQYRRTRRLFNLRIKRKRTQQPVELAVTRQPGRRASKYTEEDLVWILDHKANEIAARFEITAKQAYAVKHYAKTLVLR